MHTVNELNLMPEVLWKNLMDRFNSIYEDGVREIQRSFDLDQFGWDCWETDNDYEDDDHKSNDNELDAQTCSQISNPCESVIDIEKRDGSRQPADANRIQRSTKNMKLYIEKTMKWQSVLAKAMQEEKSAAFKRIRFIMTLFREHFLEQIVYSNNANDDDDDPSTPSGKAIYVDLFAECLSEYDAVALLNDFERIKQRRANTEELRDCKVSGPLSVCCGDLMRERRESARSSGDDHSDRFPTFDRYLQSLDRKERVLIETTSKIHSFLNHPVIYQVEEDDEDDEKRGADSVRGGRNGKSQSGPTKYRVNKFVNEMQNFKSTDSDDLPVFRFGFCSFRHYKS